jgi:cysteine desulfurase
MTSAVIYLDNNATTRMPPAVIDAMAPFYSEVYANASSRYTFASSARNACYLASERVAAMLSCAPGDVIFTSGGTESNNSAIFGLVARVPNHRRHIITSSVEHASVRDPMRILQREGYHVTEIGVSHNGELRLDELEAMVSEETALVSIMHANNETGVLFPIGAIGKITRPRGVLFHVDAVQSAGKLDINVEQSCVDALSLSAHKFHGPKGIGALYLRPGVNFHPVFFGGKQQDQRRAGTLPVSQIVGMGAAAEEAAKSVVASSRIGALRDSLESELLAQIPGARVNGAGTLRICNTTNVSFEFAESTRIVDALGSEGICVSSGAACDAESGTESHVLQAMAVPPKWLHGAIRFSLSRYTTQIELDRVVMALSRTLTRSREARGANSTLSRKLSPDY